MTYFRPTLHVLPAAGAAKMNYPGRRGVRIIEQASSQQYTSRFGVRSGALLLVWMAMVAIFLGAWRGYRPAPALAVDAAAERFSAGRALQALHELVGDNVPHPIGTAANASVRQRIVAVLIGLGYRVSQQQGFVCTEHGVCGFPTNIIGTAPDAAAGADILLLAHYDSVAAGPGAADDGSGVAAVLEIARILARESPPKNHVIVALTDGEEPGLLGARLLINSAVAARIRAVVNLDARGSGGPSLMFETGAANAWLMDLYAGAVRNPMTNSLYYTVYKRLPNDTDFTVFKRADRQGYNFAFLDDVANYHTSHDTVERLSPDSLQSQGENALAVLRALSAIEHLEPSSGEAVYFDIYGRKLIVWPKTAAQIAAGASLILLLVECFVFVRRGWLRWREGAWGLFAAVAVPIMAGVLCGGCIALLRLLNALPAPGAFAWIAHPLPMNLTAVSLSAASAGFVSGLVARRTGDLGGWLGGSLLIALFAAAISFMLPGASYSLVLGSCAATLLALPCLFFWRRPRKAPARGMFELAVLVPALVLASAMLPLLMLLYSALGTPAWSTISIGTGLIACLLLPVFLHMERRPRRRMTASASLIAASGLIATVLLPTYTNDSPQRMNIEYWLDADQNTALWWIQAHSMQMPSEMTRVANFAGAPRPRFAGSANGGFAASAPVVPLEPARLLQMSAIRGVASTRYELRLQSPRREALATTIIFPAESGIREATFASAGRAMTCELSRLSSGATSLTIRGIPAPGVNFSIEAAPGTPLLVFDQTMGLPQSLAQGTDLQVARGPTAVPSQDGDLTVVSRTVILGTSESSTRP